MGHNSFCGTHSDIGTVSESHERASKSSSASSADSHKVTIEVRDERSREVQVARSASLQGAVCALFLDAFAFLMIAVFVRHEVISHAFASLLVGGVLGARIAECRLRYRARAVAGVTAVLLGLWGVLSLCARG